MAPSSLPKAQGGRVGMILRQCILVFLRVFYSRSHKNVISPWEMGRSNLLQTHEENRSEPCNNTHIINEEIIT